MSQANSSVIIPAPSTPLSNPFTGVTAIALLTEMVAMFANKYLPVAARDNAINFTLQLYQYVLGPGLIAFGHWRHDRKARVAIVDAGGDPTPAASAPKTTATVLLVWLMLTGLFTSPVMLTGCLAKVDPGASSVTVNTERALQISVDAIDSFLQLDNDNRAVLKAKLPQMHQLAETLRVKAPPVIKQAYAALKTYQAVQTPANSDAMTSQLTALQDLATQARSALLDAAAIGLK